MRKWFLLITVLLVGNLFSQDIDYVRKQAARLSAPEMSGRGYVDDGVGRAADLLAKEFKKIGLKPIASDYLQPFTHSVNTFPGKMLIDVDGRILRPGEDFIVDPSSPSLKGDYLARVFDGNTLASIPSADRFSDTCPDCILVLDMAAVSDKELIAKARRVRGEFAELMPVIWMSNDKLTWSVADRQGAFPVIEMGPWLVQDFSPVHIDIEAELKRDYISENVVGKVKGTSYPDSFIVFTAHYDHLGMMGDSATFFGANDNASGTAFILSLARYYKKHPAKYTCVFIAFAGEEAGLVGSKFFTEHPMIDLKKIRFLINLDLMGSGVDGITVVNAPANQAEFDELVAINETHEYLPLIKPRNQTANSDHYYFSEAGVPAIFIYALGGSQAYHDIFDVNANLTFEEYPDIFKLLTELVSKL